MAQSLVKNYVHIVFSTKNRIPFIQPNLEGPLHEYLGGICRGLNCQPIKIGGYVDHVHLLCMLSKNLTLTTLLCDVKSHSSKWYKTVDKSLENFYWQAGYGAFSVNPKQIDNVIRYIDNQHIHHSKQTFKEEYIRLLIENEITYDERYVWD